MIKILAFAGSSRKDSFNNKLLEISASTAEKEGAHIATVDLDYPMPINKPLVNVSLQYVHSHV